MAGRSELDALLDLVGAGDNLLFDDKKEKTKKPDLKPDKKESMANIGGTVSHAVHTKHLVEKAAHTRLNKSVCFRAPFVLYTMCNCIYFWLSCVYLQSHKARN